MLENSSMSTPMVLKEKSSTLDMQSIDITICRSIVGALQYSTFTQPDIIYAVNRVCQFFSAPILLHLKAVKHILQYLQSTQIFGLRYLAQSPLFLYGFNDTDWAAYPTTKRSTASF